MYHSIWCCCISPWSYLQSFSFIFLFPTLTGWVPLSCLWVHWYFLLLHLASWWTPSIVFFSSVIVFFSSVISVWYFLIFSILLLKFSLCSYIVLLTSVSIFTTLILNSLSGITHLHFIKAFFWGFIVFFSLEHIFLSFFTLCVGFYKLHKIPTSPSLAGVASCRRWTLLYNPTLVLGCLSNLY